MRRNTGAKRSNSNKVAVKWNRSEMPRISTRLNAAMFSSDSSVKPRGNRLDGNHIHQKRSPRKRSGQANWKLSKMSSRDSRFPDALTGARRMIMSAKLTPDPLQKARQMLARWWYIGGTVLLLPAPLCHRSPPFPGESSGIRKIRRWIERCWFIVDQLTESNHGLIIGDWHRDNRWISAGLWSRNRDQQTRRDVDY